MGIRFSCPNGHKLNVKEFLAGKRGVCPQCGAKFVIPASDQAEPAMMASFAGTQENPGGLSAAELSSQSVMITVTDTVPSAPLIEPPPVTLQPVSPPHPVAESVLPLPSPIVTNTAAPSRPATGYELRRERSRRNQITLAIILLVAVIILAIILIVVLQNGSEPPTAPATEPAKISWLESLPQVVYASAQS